MNNQKNKQCKLYTRSNVLYLCNNNEPLVNYQDKIKNPKINTIIFDRNFNECISGVIPDNITTIIFNSESLFNNEINNLPTNLKKIRFGNYFSQSLDFLPTGLEELEFAQESTFRCLVDNLPSSLKKITFGKYFNIPINNLPYDLEYLNIESNSFMQELKNLPPNLKYLYLYNGPDYYYLKQINSIPSKLVEIQYPWNYQHPILNLPESIQTIQVNYTYKYLQELKSQYPNKKIIVY